MSDTLKKYHHIQNVRFESDALLCEIDGIERSFHLSEISKKLMQASQMEREKFEIYPDVLESICHIGLSHKKIIQS